MKKYTFQEVKHEHFAYKYKLGEIEKEASFVHKKEVDLTEEELVVLGFISRKVSVPSMKYLSQKLGIEWLKISVIVERLIALGHVIRVKKYCLKCKNKYYIM